jgi:hypothetical protein
MASYRLMMESAFLLPARCVVAAYLAVCCFAYGQASNLDQEVRVPNLPSLTAIYARIRCAGGIVGDRFQRKRSMLREEFRS